MDRKNNPLLKDNARDLRKNMTKEEKHLWYDFLRDYPVRFLKQKVIDNYIVDFYCNKARLIIELDGAQHFTEEGALKDSIRTSYIENRNLHVLRIPNYDINRHFSEVCECIDYFVKLYMGENPSTTLRWSPSL